MRRFPVAIPAAQSLVMVRISPHLVQLCRMHDGIVAADTVFLDNALACRVYPDHLWFQSEREDEGVSQAVRGLEGVMPHEIVLWHVAVVARRHLPVPAS